MFTVLHCRKTTREKEAALGNESRHYQSIKGLANLYKCNAVPHNFLHSEAICSSLAANQSVNFSLWCMGCNLIQKEKKFWKIVLMKVHFHDVQFSFIIGLVLRIYLFLPSPVPFSRLLSCLYVFVHMPWNQCDSLCYWFLPSYLAVLILATKSYRLKFENHLPFTVLWHLIFYFNGKSLILLYRRWFVWSFLWNQVFVWSQVLNNKQKVKTVMEVF